MPGSWGSRACAPSETYGVGRPVQAARPPPSPRCLRRCPTWRPSPGPPSGHRPRRPIGRPPPAAAPTSGKRPAAGSAGTRWSARRRPCCRSLAQIPAVRRSRQAILPVPALPSAWRRQSALPSGRRRWRGRSADADPGRGFDGPLDNLDLDLQLPEFGQQLRLAGFQRQISWARPATRPVSVTPCISVPNRCSYRDDYTTNLIGKLVNIAP